MERSLRIAILEDRRGPCPVRLQGGMVDRAWSNGAVALVLADPGSWILLWVLEAGGLDSGSRILDPGRHAGCPNPQGKDWTSLRGPVLPLRVLGGSLAGWTKAAGRLAWFGRVDVAGVALSHSCGAIARGWLLDAQLWFGRAVLVLSLIHI